jgi:hypothetical protein
MGQHGQKKQSRDSKWITDVSYEQRAELAKIKIRKVADQIDGLLHLHESNRILIYTDTVTSKIPRSFAASTYNLVSDCLFRYQLVRLCALWDDPSRKDRASLPVVAELIRHKNVRRILACEKYNWHLSKSVRILNPAADVEVFTLQLSMQEKLRRESGRRDAKKTIRSVLQCIKDCDEVRKSRELEALKNFRNDYVAHCLHYEQAIVDRRPQAEFGQEEKLLEKTLEIVHQLALDVTGTHYSWDEYRSIHNRCSSELWGNISFNIGHGPFS